MKKWTTPSINEINISDTEFGSANRTWADYTFRDQNGHIFFCYSGTGASTDNRKDIIDPPERP